MIWQIVTGEYPPCPGGVSDYTRVIAHGLASAGDEVHVWTPAAIEESAGVDAVQVHRLKDHFGPRAMLELGRLLSGSPEACVLLQYVPQAFGWRGMNLPFCGWLYARRRKRLMVMFHEVTFPRRHASSWRCNLLGASSRAMASLVCRAASRVFISTPIWVEVLRAQCGFVGEATWLPLPSVIPVHRDEAAVLAVRNRCSAAKSVLIGHLSSYPAMVRPQLERVLSDILARRPETSVLLLGRNSGDFHASFAARQPELSERIFAAGTLSSDDLSHHLSASDLMLQLYPDGACARRTTLIAAIAHSRAVLTTTGPATESIWEESRAVALEQNDDGALGERLEKLIDDSSLRKTYAEAAASLYRERFELRHGIQRLRGSGCELR